MTNEEKILQLLETQQKEFSKINARLDKIEEDIEEIKEDVSELKETAEITRNGVNALIEWAEDCGNAIKFPLPRIAK